jgi:hypothetical protein
LTSIPAFVIGTPPRRPTPSVPERHAPSPATDGTERLERLVYELLDPHLDTEQLMRAPSTHLVWLAHLRYLRDLQRDRGV